MCNFKIQLDLYVYTFYANWKCNLQNFIGIYQNDCMFYTVHPAYDQMSLK